MCFSTPLKNTFYFLSLIPSPEFIKFFSSECLNAFLLFIPTLHFNPFHACNSTALLAFMFALWILVSLASRKQKHTSTLPLFSLWAAVCPDRWCRWFELGAGRVVKNVPVTRWRTAASWGGAAVIQKYFFFSYFRSDLWPIVSGEIWWCCRGPLNVDTF